MTKWEYTYKCSHGTNAGPGSLGWWRSPTSSASPSSSSWPSWSSCFHSSLLLSFFSLLVNIYIYICIYLTEPEGDPILKRNSRDTLVASSRQNDKTTSHRTTSTSLSSLQIEPPNFAASFGIDLVSFNALLPLWLFRAQLSVNSRSLCD